MAIREIVKSTIKLEKLIFYSVGFEFDKELDLYWFILFKLRYVIRCRSSGSRQLIYVTVGLIKNMDITISFKHIDLNQFKFW